MSGSLLLNLAALISLVPAALAAVRGRTEHRDTVFWILLVLALAGSLAVLVGGSPGIWQTGFGPTLWVTIAATIFLFVCLSAVLSDAWRLSPLLLPYLLILGSLATIWSSAPGVRPLAADTPPVWIQVHIAAAVLTYAFTTLAAVAAVAVLVRERSVRRKRPSQLVRLLPSVTGSEHLQLLLLKWSAAIMGVGLATGMALQVLTTGSVLVLDHKVLFAFLSFGVIVALLLAHMKTGVRGRRAAQLVMLAYLLISLGFPGVKFVTDILMA